MSKHTPLPWTQGTGPEGKECVWLNGHTQEKSGFIGNKYWIDCNTEENARLIAASPEMLAVLKELQESAAYWSEYDVPLGIVDRINQAIAKAEGA
jgi:hypothetical protein